MPTIFFAIVATGCSNEREVQNGDLLFRMDSRMYVNVRSARQQEGSFYADFVPADYLLMREATAKEFRLKREDRLAKGRRLIGEWQSDGYCIEKIVDITLPDSLPDMLLYQVHYVNKGKREPTVTGWVNHDIRLSACNEDSLVWSLQPSSTSARKDWLLPVTPGFYRKNYLGMNNSDYGGGIPVSDLWRSDGGVAVGVAETVLKLVSLPVEMQKYTDCARTRVEYEYPHPLTFKENDTLSTFRTFICVHAGDCYTPLQLFSRYMQSQGITFPKPEAQAYEPVWCAWGYERTFTADEILNTLPKVKELGFKWVDVDDGYQTKIGDWEVNRRLGGGPAMRRLVDAIHACGLKAKLWWTPLTADPDAEVWQTTPGMKLLTNERLPRMVTWWNTFYLSPVNPVTQAYNEHWVTRFIRDWDFDGLKLDGQHLNCCPPDYNPASRLTHPLQAIEQLPRCFEDIYETARRYKSDAVIQICPCGTAINFFLLPYMNQTVASDPQSSRQIRQKAKVYRALMGEVAYYADHVELSDGGCDFATQVGVGAVIGSKFTYPKDNPDVRTSYLLTPEKETLYRKWLGIYNDKMLSEGEYLNLYDIGFDKPETHVIRKDGKMYYAFYAKEWKGKIRLRGLEKREYTVREYANDASATYRVDGIDPVIDVSFKDNYLIEIY